MSLTTYCPPETALEAVEFLAGCYGKAEAEDPAIYAQAIASIFIRYPEDVVRQVVHPNDGLPGSHKWLPKVAEVKAACEALMKPYYREQARERTEREGLVLLGKVNDPTPEERDRAAARAEEFLHEMRNTQSAAEIRQDADKRLKELYQEVRQPLAIGSLLAGKLEQIKQDIELYGPKNGGIPDYMLEQREKRTGGAEK